MARQAFQSLEPGVQTDWVRVRAAELLVPALYRTATYIVSAEELAAILAAGAGQGPDRWGQSIAFDRYAAALARKEFRWDDAIALDRRIAAMAQAEPEDLAHLAFDLATLAQFDEAERTARLAAEEAARSKGQGDPATLRTRSDLGEILLHAGKVDEAESLLQAVVAEMNAGTATTYDLPLALRRLADCALFLGRVSEAEPLLARALAAELDLSDQFVLSDDYDRFATTRTLARVQAMTGRGRRAARALAGELAVAGNKTPASLQLLLDYLDFADEYATADERSSAAYFASADDESSLAIANGALGMARQLFAEPHPLILRAMTIRARLLAGSGAARAEADEAFKEAIALARQLPGDATTGGLEIRVAYADHLLKQPAQQPLALAITKEAVLIARTQRAALRGAGGVIVDPAIRRAFFQRVAALLMGPARPAPARMDEAFQTLQEADVSLSALAVARAALGRIARTPQETALVAEFEAAQRDAQRQDRLLHAAVARGDGTSVTRLIGAARTAREREAAAQRAVESAFPAYARLAKQPVIALQAARDALPAGGVLLLLSGDERDALAMLVTKTDLVLNRQAGESRKLSRSLAMMQCTLDPRTCDAEASTALGRRLAAAGWEPDDPRSAFDLDAARELHAALVAPFAAKLPAGAPILAVQQGSLAALPLAALPRLRPPAADAFDPAGMKQVRWLIDDHPIAALPYAGVLAQGSARAAGAAAPRSFFGIGNPVLSGKPAASRGMGELFERRGGSWQVATDRLRALAPLPATKIELEAMAEVMKAAPEESLRLGSRASETEVKADPRVGEAGILAFATHGLMPSQLQGVQEPGLVLTPPAVPSEVDDGLWTASEVSLLRTSASLVVLSACNTASSEGTPGADALSGLARAFFLSGARSVLASRWSVPDAATAALTVEMLSGLANGGLDQPAALQRAMRAVRTGTRGDGTPLPAWKPDWAHPTAWAAFAVYMADMAR